jgi:alpha-tubulin suppressor-like RCC1 family protein
MSTATVVSAGGFHTCVVLESGEVRCWGSGYDGQLGNSSKSSSSTPVTVTFE